MSPVSPGHNKRKVHLCGQTGLTGVRWRRRKRKANWPQVSDCISARSVSDSDLFFVSVLRLAWVESPLRNHVCDDHVLTSRASAVPQPWDVMIVGPHHVWTRQDKNVKAGLCFLISLTCSILHLGDHMWMFSHTHTLPHCVCVYQPIIVSSAMISGCHSNRQRAAGW